MKLLIIAVFAFLLWGFSVSAFALGPSDLPNFHEVIAHQIYRGAQPSPAGIRALAAMGIKTIVDLRDENPPLAQKEKQFSESLGLKEFLVPMNANVTPDDGQIAVLENQILSDPSLRPVFVHCHYGEDRTGLVIGLHRVFKETPAMTPAQAYAEMLQIGFHPDLQALANYFFAKTNWTPPNFGH